MLTTKKEIVMDPEINPFDANATRTNINLQAGGPVLQPRSEFNLNLCPLAVETPNGIAFAALGGFGLDKPRIYAKTPRGDMQFNERISGPYLEAARSHLFNTYCKANIFKPGDFLAGTFLRLPSGRGYAFKPLRNEAGKLVLNRMPPEMRELNAVITYQPLVTTTAEGLDFSEAALNAPNLDVETEEAAA